MLTSKSNFNTFRELKDKQVTDKMLQQLYDNCTSKDFINLNGNLSKGYPAEIASFIIQKIKLENINNIKVLVFNDLSFHMYNCLTNAGILPKNITLAFGKWNKDGTVSDDKKVYNIMNMFAKSNFVEFEHDAKNIVTLKEIMNMKNKNIKFDYIISNPPYEIGNEITRAVIDFVDFDHFINLMPISKYKSNKLYQYIIPETITHAESTVGFDGAYTTPICAEVSKEKVSDDNYDIFEIKSVFDQRLSKFWNEQLNRKTPFLTHNLGVLQKDFDVLSSKTSFSCGIYTTNIMLGNGPKTLKNRDDSFRTDDRHYIWNFLKPDNTIDNYFKPSLKGGIGQTVTVFATEQEADNFKNWAHSGELSGKGRLQGLFSILLRGMNKPTSCPFPYAIPRVDWTRPWTDEEILRDYGYTEDEIKQILRFNDDLIKNNAKEEIE